MTASKDIDYHPPHKDCNLDVFVPKSANPVPLLVFFHGGGWISGNKSMYAEEVSYFTSHGIACACVGYRLAPLHPFPAACDDALASIAYLRANAKSLGVNPNLIVAMGNSAGGHLSCLAGLQPTRSDGSPSQNANAVITICPITDMRNPDETHYPISMSFLEQFMGGSYNQSPENYETASPVTHVHEAAPPFLIFHGTDDDIVPCSQSKLLYDRLNLCGVSAQLHLLEGEGHSFTYPSWQKIRDHTLEFVKTI